MCTILTTHIRGKTNTKQTHTITKILIQLALKIIHEIKLNIYFTVDKSFIDVCRSLHAAFTQTILSSHQLFNSIR